MSYTPPLSDMASSTVCIVHLHELHTSSSARHVIEHSLYCPPLVSSSTVCIVRLYELHTSSSARHGIKHNLHCSPLWAIYLLLCSSTVCIVRLYELHTSSSARHIIEHSLHCPLYEQPPPSATSATSLLTATTSPVPSHSTALPQSVGGAK